MTKKHKIGTILLTIVFLTVFFCTLTVSATDAATDKIADTQTPSPQEKQAEESDKQKDITEQTKETIEKTVDSNDPNLWPGTEFHEKCSAIFSNYVDNNGRVKYSKLRRKRLELLNLLLEFNSLDPQVYSNWPEKDKIAFWINAYNAQMLSIIIENYPIQSNRILRVVWGPKSIRHILRENDIWNDNKFFVMDEEFTLKEIETRFFRNEFSEPKVFFALSLASKSSPLLRNEPYFGYKLDEQLEDQTVRFLKSSEGFRINTDNKNIYIPAILQPGWYGSEFIKKYRMDKRYKAQKPAVRAVLNFITNYLEPQDISFLEQQVYTVKFINYNWTLNE